MDLFGGFGGDIPVAEKYPHDEPVQQGKLKIPEVGAGPANVQVLPVVPAVTPENEELPNSDVEQHKGQEEHNDPYTTKLAELGVAVLHRVANPVDDEQANDLQENV